MSDKGPDPLVTLPNDGQTHHIVIKVECGQLVGYLDGERVIEPRDAIEITVDMHGPGEARNEHPA